MSATLEAIVDSAVLEALRKTSPTIVKSLTLYVKRGATPKQILSLYKKAGASPTLLNLIDGAVHELRALRQGVR